MSDRFLREFQRNLTQQLDRMRRDIRTLSLQAWRGATRSVDVTEFFPSTPGNFEPAASVTVPSGRWIVLAKANFVYPGLSVGVVLPRLDVTYTDPETGLAPAGLITIADDTAGYAAPLEVANQINSVSTWTDFVAPDSSATVTVRARDAAGLDYTLRHVSLRCLPS